MPQTKYHTHIHINKHTCSYFNSHVYRNQEGEQNIMKLQSALLQINFLPITQFCNIYSLKPHQNTSCSPIFQNFKHCISWVMIFYDVISMLCLYNTQYKQKCGPSRHNFNVPITNGSYMFQLHSNHHQAVYVRSIRGNFIPAPYI